MSQFAYQTRRQYRHLGPSKVTLREREVGANPALPRNCEVDETAARYRRANQVLGTVTRVDLRVWAAMTPALVVSSGRVMSRRETLF
ncbi:hypothetical protein GS4_21_00080 [Gordonia soli NBRC 108243]|uniref:Uncharacterized protein n=1 Tax=Gordonia soli NBRC 108243 TaxID=1223545 RepID=M0QLH3_9ACTN|nr:hypothetical protein GS4_21_00080 [Gordonia soli NBRC 108243]